MIAPLKKIPVVLQNIRGARNWRARDMINWHRMVKPLRSLSSEALEDYDLFQLIVDVCTRLSIGYTPHDKKPDVLEPDTVPLQHLRADSNEPHVGLFFDSPDHTSGVGTTIQSWHEHACDQGCELSLFSSGFESSIPDTVCFTPMGTMHFDAYSGLHMHVPCITQVMQYLEEHPLDIMHISTPGPMGLLGLMLGRMKGLPVCGTYHTDFPRYAVELTGNRELEKTTWQFMRWFYGQMDLVATPSQSTLNELVEHGFDRDKLVVVGRGINTDNFSPSHRSSSLRAAWGEQYKHKLLYVGRVSEEKNLGCLVEAFKQVIAQRSDTCLVVTGDGPYKDRMAAELAGLPVVFTGIQKGTALSEIYASSDLFVFPSETDTFGVVLIEAQAAGVPVVVSPKGGPKDCVLDNVTGRIVDMSPDNLAASISYMLDDPRFAAMRKAARRHAVQLTPERSFADFWQMLHRCISQHTQQTPSSSI